MLLNDLLQESNVSWWNKALYVLDKLFGFHADGNSKLKRVKQVFDQKTGEHVIYLEYRVKSANQSPIRQSTNSINPKRSDKTTKGSK